MNVHPLRRGSTRAALVLALAGLAFISTWLDRATLDDRRQALATRALVASLGLTDLALFNEARYTRHPSQADRHAAFQDHPMALEHFPSGSLLSAPEPGRP